MSKKRLLFAASEVYPFAKTGGLADVAYALPRALNEAFSVEVVMPLYRNVDRQKYSIQPVGESFDVRMGTSVYPVQLYGCSYRGIQYRFVYSPLLCDRDYLYGHPEAGYEDNAIRFGIFNYVLFALLETDHYAAVHLNDWQCALTALLVHERPQIHSKVVYTIHNLAYQGSFPHSALTDLGIDTEHYGMEGIEFYGQVNFMKAGIAYADVVTTVSPTYAKEILTPEFGCGLDGFLNSHSRKLVGILNGIDTDHFSPMNDPFLIRPYSDLKEKRSNKSDYLKSVGLKGVNKPLFVFIGRFTGQKGMDLLMETLPKIAEQECTVAILGDGEAQYHDPLREMVSQLDNVHLYFGYDEAIAHRMYAASDFLLMPSLFEPCGLNQLIAFEYGAIPVVHHVGGLVDSVKKVEKFNAGSENGYGIAFERPTSRSFFNAVIKALELYEDKRRYNTIIKHNMSRDFSWSESAKVYAELYEGPKAVSQI